MIVRSKISNLSILSIFMFNKETYVLYLSIFYQTNIHFIIIAIKRYYGISYRNR